MPLFERKHKKPLEALRLAMQNGKAKNAINKAIEAGISWDKILAVLLQQLPNILAQNWPAVVMALLQLIVPKPA